MNAGHPATTDDLIADRIKALTGIVCQLGPRLTTIHHGVTRYRIELDSLTIEILEITEDGRPHEVAFHFDRELENEFFRWIRWEDGIYVPFHPPRVGETVTLPAIRLSPSG